MIVTNSILPAPLGFFFDSTSPANSFNTIEMCWYCQNNSIYCSQLRNFLNQ
ncbi:hypothetical protein HBI56_041460 [Parastagonospora nodorum]|uniref:Uncharacterized protein n=1 Tax=Phaeosphaeria nodorum (strain SN15 / ATCC MYA-4574 / FGSC 10173) TaxID=321614 RepID=A0A7U2EUD3_PHANO|nr:hypothetical protein HBH56_065300 [Parastagonospora nodorum]QRC93251.1 hypothetical protein JI435_403470 [Parastagonospora nodorum SN15]KAH3932770.1 hypothetical protein HBH54_082790 [Parastagonospora nodorum]KAH3955164.1 hypothetical protein HBH53_011600 [Parastagonospora nodorum]KAH3988327.1 hypothetical protein HBH51_006260 [Parastagonospora nodorum]